MFEWYVNWLWGLIEKGNVILFKTIFWLSAALCFGIDILTWYVAVTKGGIVFAVILVNRMLMAHLLGEGAFDDAKDTIDYVVNL